MAYNFVQVLGESVVVVARCWLAGFAEPSPVIRDDAVTRFQKARDLLLPGSTAQRISVDQDDGLTRAVVLIVQIHVAGVFLTNPDVWHSDTSPFWLFIVPKVN